MNYEIATPLSQAVLQLIQRERALGQEFRDSTNRRLRSIPGAYEEFFPTADDPGDRAEHHPISRLAVGESEVVSTWHVHRRQR